MSNNMSYLDKIKTLGSETPVLLNEMDWCIDKTHKFTQALFKSAPLGLTIFDEQVNIIDCNDFILKMCGAEKQYYMDHFFDFSPEYQPNGMKSIEWAFDIMRRAIAGETKTVDWVHKSIDGEMIPCELTVTCIEHNNEYTGLAFTYDLRNINKISHELETQSEQLKVRLAQQELISEITKSFVTSGDSGVLINDAAGKLREHLDASRVIILCIDYNNSDSYLAYSQCAPNAPQFTRSTHDAFNIIKGLFPETLFDIDNTPVITCDDAAWHPVFNTLPADGINAIVAAPLYVDGQLWGVICVEQCMTRKWQDIEVSLITTIADVIASAIIRLIYSEKLKNALDRATAASEAKGVFLSNMSHEIRTPMNAIIGMTGIGKSADELQRKDYCFEKIENASQHLLGVINDILDMSKIEANKFELSNIEFDFEKMLHRVVNMIMFKADEKKQIVTVNIDKSIPRTLIGDDQRLAQVITNLLSNAVKFTPEEGSIRLDTRFLNEENGVYTIRISVKDSGIGITPQQQQQIFHSFQQAESGTTRRFGGTGLGLVISKNIVEMMGGSIELNSSIGKGSSFSFTFKAKHGARVMPCLSDIGINRDNVSIMAVDDDQEVLNYFRDTMQGFGLKCDTALSGQEALELIGTNGMYNIFFVDWKMPGMDGIMLAKELKSISKTPEHTVVIMISAAEWSSIADDAKNAGVDKFLSKPLFPSSILDTITETIGMDNQPDTFDNNEGIFKGYKVLLAEDVEINREIVSVLVEPTLIDIDCAENGIKAVEMYEKSPDDYDLILMDVQMPEMDGYEATRKIRKFEANREENLSVNSTEKRNIISFSEGESQRHPHKHIPIIAMTANVFREDIEKCINAGMNEHIGKPLDIKEFFSVMRKYLPEHAAAG